MNHAAICVRGVSKTYAQGAAAVRALTGVDLDLQCGELTLLMGPSGSGKTTLISLLLRFYDPQSGRVCVEAQVDTPRQPLELGELPLRERRAHRGHDRI